MWLFVYGPGNRLHDVPARRLFYLTIAFQNAGVFIYHQKARQYLKSPVQQVFLRRLFWSEIFTIFLGVPLGIVIFIQVAFFSFSSREIFHTSVRNLGGAHVVRRAVAGRLQEFGNGLLPPTIGPNKTEIMPTHFSLRLMPIAGVTALPGMLHAVLAVRRDWLVPRMGDDILSPVFFQRSLIISYLAGVAGMSLVFVVISSIAMRYMEYDMGGGFRRVCDLGAQDLPPSRPSPSGIVPPLPVLASAILPFAIATAAPAFRR